ncbi:MAG: MHS family MFS transporter [Methanobacteriota archaeon]|nr:MAG: MHS family MFS transporter [Euryarchaeota archaeon]
MATGVGSAAGSFGGEKQHSMRFIVAASGAGTVIEWYDFYIFGSLATLMAVKFFHAADTGAFLLTLGTFAAGFAVRPFGAVVFGRIGDLVGRKYAFLLTITIMGAGTTLIGVLPEYAAIGVLAPLILLALRVVQGLALGGEYGGAVVYTAEHAPDERRGYWTSYIQTTATLGLFMALGVILALQLGLGTTTFNAWGWRVPFLLSAFLVAASLFIRWRLRETPLFSRLKREGRTSKHPTREALGNWANWKLILLALFGATAGQAVVWYTGQFYSLYFMQVSLKMDRVLAAEIVLVALALATPFFIVFGRLSDRIGRKKIIMAGCLLAALTYYPIFAGIAANASPPNVPVLIGLNFVLVFYVTMVYAPIAAFLVEFFPARIRYTCLSVPYHLGNGEFGGFTPVIAVAIAAWTGNIFAGLAWAIVIPLMTFVIGMKYLPETKDTKIWEEVTPGPAYGGPASMPRTGADVGTTMK